MHEDIKDSTSLPQDKLLPTALCEISSTTSEPPASTTKHNSIKLLYCKETGCFILQHHPNAKTCLVLSCVCVPCLDMSQAFGKLWVEICLGQVCRPRHRFILPLPRLVAPLRRGEVSSSKDVSPLRKVHFSPTDCCLGGFEKDSPPASANRLMLDLVQRIFGCNQGGTSCTI